MADLTVRTQDVSVRDESTGEYGAVNADKEQLVHDQDAHDILQEIADSTGGVNDKIATSWQYYASIDKAFVANRTATLSPAGEHDFILLHNPVDSGYQGLIKLVNFGVQTPATSATFRLYTHPTVTDNGTALTKENYRTTDGAGVIGAYYEPTITDRDHIFKVFELNSTGVGALRIDEDLAIYLLEGYYLLVTIETSSANKTFSVNVSWAEDLLPTP